MLSHKKAAIHQTEHEPTIKHTLNRNDFRGRLWERMGPWEPKNLRRSTS